MIILIGGIKGGCGKTTLSVNLASYLASIGKETLLVDSDDQQTATDYTILRNATHPDLPRYTQVQLYEEAVLTQVLNLKKNYEYTIIDTGGRDTSSQRAALGCCDIAIIPFIPRVFDIWTTNRIIKLAEELRPFNQKLDLYACLNKADPSGQQNKEAAEMLIETGSFNFIPHVLVNRKIYGTAAASGLSVLEVEPKDRKAEEEFKNFADYVIGIKQ